MADFIKEEKLDNAIIVKLSGKIGTEEASQLKKKLVDINEENKTNILLDVNNCEYICSLGLGVMLNLYKILQENKKKIIIINTNPNIDESFTTTKMNDILNIVPDRAGALAIL